MPRWQRLRFDLASVLLLPVLISGFGGCAQQDREINAFIHDWEASVSGTSYVVQPPDTIEISSSNAPEIDGEVLSLRQDGKVSLRLVGEVKVAGLTPVEIARKLELILRKYYVDPNVSVRVVNRASKRVYVFGQVRRAGAHRYTGRDTVLSLLALAHPNHIAWENQVKVIRPSHRGDERHVLTVDVDKIMKEGDLELNFHLEEGDIVYVPPTPLGWLGLRIQELLFPLSPMAETVILPGSTVDEVDEDFDE